MKHLAIDYGLSRTGLAATDPDGILAYPLATLDLARFPTRRALLEALSARIREEAPAIVVVGLPLLEDGSETLTTKQVRNFVRRLLHRIEAPVYLMPELLSSFEAEGDLDAAGVKGKKRRAVLDQQAAVRILESYLAAPQCAHRAEPDGHRAAAGHEGA